MLKKIIRKAIGVGALSIGVFITFYENDIEWGLVFMLLGILLIIGIKRKI